jgi:hypothetical protein
MGGAASGARPRLSGTAHRNLYKVAANKSGWLGAVEAPDDATAVERTAAEFKAG